MDNQLYPNTQEITYPTHDQHEIIWIKINTTKTPTFLGAYYGPQEKIDNDTVYREYQEIRTTLTRLQEQGDVMLIGDFNAKLNINTPKYKQQQTRNGALLQEIIENTNITPLNTKEEHIHWTRENRTNQTEKSIIDYVIVDQQLENSIRNLKVDNTNHLTLKGTKPTDHNTITLELRKNTHKQQQTTKKIWAKGNANTWNEFNRAMQINNADIRSYDELEKKITNSLRNTIGIITIKGNGRKKETEETKQLRKNKKTARKELDKAIKNKTDITKTKIEYIKHQVRLRIHIAAQIEMETTRKMNKLLEQGPNLANNFWKIRKKILHKQDNLDNYLKDEEGKEIRNHELRKAHIADYYEDLYQARQNSAQYKQHNDNIIKINKQNRENTEKNHTDPFTKKELETVIKKLKNNKATGPDNIPNEALTQADKKTRKIYLKHINKITKTKVTPSQWQKGEIIRIYKGKGTKGKCSNERGITLSSNMGKTYERLINNRILNNINITDAQAGGRKGMSTSDHILRMKETITTNKNKKKPTYITFLDVTKAYDKAWLEGIMNIMYERGCTGSLWNITDKLNQNLTASIKTTHGKTRDIKINNSIRQGGVLAVTQYATLMDEINKEIQERKLTQQIKIDPESKCLLWVDDVAIITNNIKDQKTMLQITEEIADKYRIKFGENKTKLLQIGKKQEAHTLTINNFKIENTANYKYLGETINTKNNIDDHIKGIEQKTEAALQTILYIATDDNFRGIQMYTIWTLLETCIIPIITYSAETWEINKTQMKRLNTILDNIIKRTLRIPQTTPRESIYEELRILDIEHRIIIKRTKYAINLIERNPVYMHNTISNTNNNSWIKKTQQMAEDIEINIHNPQKKTKKQMEEIIKRTTTTKMLNKNQEKGNTKSKYHYLTEHKNKQEKRPQYLDKLTRNHTRAIFMARTRMIRIKGNYKNKYQDQKCRGCGHPEESQKHILEICPTIHNDQQSKIPIKDIFSDNLITLKETAQKLNKIEAITQEWDNPQNQPIA